MQNQFPMDEEIMDEQFKENIDYIREWIESGSYKEENPVFDKASGYTVVDFVADYILPYPNPEDEDEFNITEIPLRVYIDEKNSFRLEFNKPLFDWYFKGYETEENTSVVEKFMEYVEKEGLGLNS